MKSKLLEMYNSKFIQSNYEYKSAVTRLLQYYDELPKHLSYAERKIKVFKYIMSIQLSSEELNFI